MTLNALFSTLIIFRLTAVDIIYHSYLFPTMAFSESFLTMIRFFDVLSYKLFWIILRWWLSWTSGFGLGISYRIFGSLSVALGPFRALVSQLSSFKQPLHADAWRGCNSHWILGQCYKRPKFFQKFCRVCVSGEWWRLIVVW